MRARARRTSVRSRPAHHAVAWPNLLTRCAIGVAISFLGFWSRSLVSATCYTVLGVANKMLTVLANVLISHRQPHLASRHPHSHSSTQGHTMSPSPPSSPAGHHYPLPHAGAHLGSPCLSCGHLIPHRLSARSGELQAGPNGRGALGHTLATAPPGDGQPSHSHPHPHLRPIINSAARWLALTLNLAPPTHPLALSQPPSLSPSSRSVGHSQAPCSSLQRVACCKQAVARRPLTQAVARRPLTRRASAQRQAFLRRPLRRRGLCR